MASEPGEPVSAAAMPAPTTIAADTPAATTPALNHTKNRSTMPSPVPDRENGNARCQSGSRFSNDTCPFIGHRRTADRFMLRSGGHGAAVAPLISR